jgi:dihydrofolate reductase
MSAVVSLDGFMADDNDEVGPLFAALKLGLIDQVVVNQVPVVFGSGRPFFATGRLAEPLLLENPTTIVRGDRVTHLVYDVSR